MLSMRVLGVAFVAEGNLQYVHCIVDECREGRV